MNNRKVTLAINIDTSDLEITFHKGTQGTWLNSSATYALTPKRLRRVLEAVMKIYEGDLPIPTLEVI